MLKHAVIEKRADAVIRWLERFKKSYSSGAVETALMDAECARADIEALRLDVFGRLGAEKKGEHKFFSRLLGFSRVAFLAGLVVMLAVFPISRDIPSPVIEHDRESVVLAEPIAIIREDAQELVAEVRPEPPAISQKSKKVSRTQSTKKPSQAQPVAAEKTTSKPKPKAEPEKGKSVAYDKVFSLMQTGQRALKNNSSVIKIK